MDGNGIGLVSNRASTAAFDLDGNGIAEQTAWFSATDAILVHDTNRNGSVDGIQELFNNIDDANGFAMLARTMDSNGDGIINAQDAGWTELQLWVDADQNAVSTTGELKTLTEAGIESISTTTTDTAVYYEGAYLPIASIVTMQDGSTRVIGDVFFTNQNDGEVRGAATHDLLVFSATADVYDGGSAGHDTLWLQTGGNTLNLGTDVSLHSVEALDARNGKADTLNLNLADVLEFAEGGIFTVRGDAVDVLHLSHATQGADVVQNGETFASYTSANGAQLLVAAGIDVQLDEARLTSV
jgi:hypothetical protein